ncbi:MAG: GreA/GreB family elongation factor [Desulfosalsimonas sp.]|uniref:GreA/GreB family elongation factor n=1 Tax=Desulfosalsimonas sp. TaxID=3073848 RepID=UPI00397076DE
MSHTRDAKPIILTQREIDLEETESGRPLTYQIVGDDEADIKLGMISVSSPIARALIGKEEGDIVTVQAPGGNIEYTAWFCNFRMMPARWRFAPC